MTLTDVWRHRPNVWLSGHPDASPYFLEFIPLLRQDGGVPLFQRSMAFEEFIPADGVEGALGHEQSNYLRLLISLAADQAKSPILSCTRSLGRVGALKTEFGGTHIVLHRNLFQQWCSFSGQARTGNWYFVESLLNTIRLGQSRDPFLAVLNKYIEASGLLPVRDLSAIQSDELFAVFLAFHTYLLIRSIPKADLFIHLNRLSETDGKYRAEVEDKFAAATGKKLSLNGCHESLDIPMVPIHDGNSVELLVQGLVERALQTFDGGSEADDLCAWILQESFSREAQFRVSVKAFGRLAGGDQQIFFAAAAGKYDTGVPSAMHEHDFATPLDVAEDQIAQMTADAERLRQEAHCDQLQIGKLTAEAELLREEAQVAKGQLSEAKANLDYFRVRQQLRPELGTAELAPVFRRDEKPDIPGALRSPMMLSAEQVQPSAGSQRGKADSRQTPLSQAGKNKPLTAEKCGDSPVEDKTATVSIGGVTFSVNGRDSDPYFVTIQQAVTHNELFLLAISRLRPDSSIIDLGANIGSTVAMAGLSLPGSQILAVEPSPLARGHLQKTIELNGLADRVRIIPACVGPANGAAKFFEADFLAGSHLVLSGETTHAANIAVEVPMKSVDQIVADAKLDRLDLIKIDIEGFELGALKGAANTLGRFKPLILMEFNSFALTAFGDTSPRSLLDYIRTNFGSAECLGPAGNVESLTSQDEYLAFLHRNMTQNGCVDDLLFRA